MYSQKGQSISEYAMILSIITMMAVIGITLLGHTAEPTYRLIEAMGGNLTPAPTATTVSVRQPQPTSNPTQVQQPPQPANTEAASDPDSNNSHNSNGGGGWPVGYTPTPLVLPATITPTPTQTATLRPTTSPSACHGSTWWDYFLCWLNGNQ